MDDVTLLFATDLDGTLLGPDSRVSARTRAALRRAFDHPEMDVVFVTGRPLRWMTGIADETGHDGTAICANGALVLDLVTMEPEAVHGISEPTAEEVRARLSELEPNFAFGSESAAGEVVKLLAWAPSDAGHHVDLLLPRALERVNDLVEVTHSNPDDLLLEMSALGVSKASTLEHYAAERGLSPEHVVAVGDMPNDIPMLRWAGQSYAVGNAHPHAAAAADAVIPANTEDGVAQLLEQVLDSLE